MKTPRYKWEAHDEEAGLIYTEIGRLTVRGKRLVILDLDGAHSLWAVLGDGKLGIPRADNTKTKVSLHRI